MICNFYVYTNRKIKHLMAVEGFSSRIRQIPGFAGQLGMGDVNPVGESSTSASN
jgi:hypothetical protein